MIYPLGGGTDDYIVDFRTTRGVYKGVKMFVSTLLQKHISFDEVYNHDFVDEINKSFYDYKLPFYHITYNFMNEAYRGTPYYKEDNFYEVVCWQSDSIEETDHYDFKKKDFITHMTRIKRSLG